MGEVGSAAALLVAAVFAWTGARKTVAPDVTASSFRALGVPAPRTAARVLPLAELAIAGLLVVLPRVGATLAIVALAGFSAVLGRALVKGVEVGCGCFGATATDPVSVADLLRNGLLALAAALAGFAATHVPSLPAVLLVGGGALAGMMLIAMLRLRSRVGGSLARDALGARP